MQELQQYEFSQIEKGSQPSPEREQPVAGMVVVHFYFAPGTGYDFESVEIIFHIRGKYNDIWIPGQAGNDDRIVTGMTASCDLYK